MSQARHNLDELLARMPSGKPTAKSGMTTDVSKASGAMTSLAERTLGQLAGHAHRPSRIQSELSALDLDDVLRTPLPLEPGEPGTEGGAVVAPLASGQGMAKEPAFGDVFAPELDETADFDPLRIPQQSGEHAPVTRISQAESGATDGLRDVASGRRRLAWLWGGASALAAAAALVLIVRSPGVLAPKSEARLGVAATDQPTSESAASAAMPLDPVTASPAAVAVEAPAEAAQVALAEEAAQPKPAVVQSPGSSRKMAGAVHAKAAPGGRGESVTVGLLPPEEPSFVPAAGPSELPDHPSMGAIAAATAGPLSQARQCLTADFPRATARVSFGSTGKVTQVSIVEPTTPAAVRSCISAALGRSQVAPFARKQYEASLSVSAR